MFCIGCVPPPLYCQPCGADADTFPAYSLVEHGSPMEIVQFSMPTPTGNQVLVRTTYAGMCHSDLHLWEGHFDLGGGVKLPALGRTQISRSDPRTLGHEFEGVIVAAGENVPIASFDMEKSYAIFPWIGCDLPDECVQCQVGNMNWCRSPKSQRYIDGNSKYGGYSSHILVPHYKYLLDYEGAVPEGLGCVYMCSGLTAFSALECAFSGRNPPQHPEDLVILGCGGLGLQGIGMAIAMRGAPLACDIAEEKLAEASRLGCKVFDSSKDKSIQEIRKLSNGGVAAVIDFVGSDKSFAFADSIIRVGGKVVNVGLLGGKMEKPLPMLPLMSKSYEGCLVGNMRQAEDMLKLLRGGKVPIAPHHFRSIFEVNSAMKDLADGKIVGRCVLKHDWSGPEKSKI